MENSIASKRWDAVGVAAFALGELLGGNDAPTAAAALMLYQVYLLRLYYRHSQVVVRKEEPYRGRPRVNRAPFVLRRANCPPNRIAFSGVE